MEVESLGKPGWMRAWVRMVAREQRGRDIEDKQFEDETNSTYLGEVN